MNTYSYTIVVIPLHLVFGLPNFSPLCLWIRSAYLISLKCLSFISSDVFFSIADDLPTGIFSFSEAILMFSCITRGSLSISPEIFSLQVISCVGPCFMFLQLRFPSPAVQPLFLDIETFFSYLMFLPSRFPFLH